MKKTILVFLLLSSSLFPQALADSSGWIPLFNGHDLTGWYANRRADSFTVVFDAIALQTHDTQSTWSFKDIRIKPLP